MRKTKMLAAGMILGFILNGAALFADVQLEGINYDAASPQESLALINGKLVKAGETVEDYQVVKVDRLEVHLKNLKTSEGRVLDMNKAAAENRSSAAATPEDRNPLAGFLGNFQKKPVAKPGPPVFASKTRKTASSPDKLDKSSTQTLGMMSALQDIIPGSGPVGAYRSFMNHVFRGEFDKAREFVERGSSAESILASKQAKYGPCVGEHGKRFSSASYKVVSKKESGKGQIILNVTQTASGDPPGATSAFGSAVVIYNHQASMVKTANGWKIRSFQYSPAPESKKGMGPFWLCA